MKALDARFELRSLFFQEHEISKQIVIIGIDDDSIKKIPEPFILWDTLFAAAIEKTAQSGAKVIGLDMIWVKSIDKFIQRSEKDKNALKRSLLKSLHQYHIPIVMATGSLARKNSKNGRLEIDSSQPMAIFGKIIGKQGFGMVNTLPDSDNYIRRVRLYYQDLNDNSQFVPAFYTAVANRYDEINRIDPIRNSSFANIQFINFQPQKSFQTLSFFEVLEAAKNNNLEYFKDNFKNKIVLFGFTNASGDILPSLLSQETPGVLLHAQTIEMLIKQNFLKQNNGLYLLLGLLLLAVIIAYLASKKNITVTFAIVMGLMVVYFASNLLLFKNNIFFPFVAPIVFIIISFSSLYIYRFMVEEHCKRRLAKFFSSYVNEQVVQDIINSNTPISLKGKKETICVLFSDIRGFTTFSEKLSPEEVVATLNQYFSEMTQVILDHHGTVDKFIGDGLMAFFGAPLKSEDSTLNAAKAALEMRKKLAELNVLWQSQGKPQLNNGIGLHTGEALVGNIGSEKKMEYTAIGDSVNTASRVEGLTKTLSAPILMTKDSFLCVTDQVNAIYKGAAKLKGRSDMVVYELKSVKEGVS